MAVGWQSLAQAKRDAILNSIPAKWRLETIPSSQEQKDITGSFIQQFLNEDEIEKTETDAAGIAEKVAAGLWSAVAVTEAFCHRASLAHQLVNCLHETFFDAALASAKSLDEYYLQHGKTIGPLHGVPVSLKDQFHVANVETTMGYVGWIGTFEGVADDPRQGGKYESGMVRELRALGAILYCKTSVPHTLMSGETVNNIIGYTWNPKNRFLCSGGSSGGEGALIGLRGSPGGFGTDIGGSIRIPAAFNGLYGLRPSGGRLPYEGMANSMDGSNTILSVVGPLATTARSLKLLTRSILSQEPWLHDPLVIDMPWRDAQEQAVYDAVKPVSTSRKKLSFAVMMSDGTVNPQPPVARAVAAVADALTKAGHKVIEWKPPAHDRILTIAMRTWYYDGGKDVHAAFALSGEPMSSQIKLIYGDHPREEATGSQIAANNVAKRQYQKEYLDYWNGTAQETGTGEPVDGVICPLAPYAAARPEKYAYYGYSIFVNGLDYTSVIVPVTTCDKSKDRYAQDYMPINEQDKQAFEDYDADLYDGAHVSVQIFGRRFTEEKMIAIADYVGGLLEE